MSSLPLSRPAATPALDLPDPRRWWALVVIALAQLMIVLDATIVSIALPSMQVDLGMSDSNRQWVITAYTLAFGGLLLLGGRVADFLGRKRALFIGLAGFAAASALGGAAQNVPMLLSSRALQGVFGAILAPSALSLLALTFRNPAERAKAIGIFGAVSAGGSALGLILGGALTEYLDWRFTFYVNVPIAVLGILGARAFIRADLRSSNPVKFDFGGAILGTAGLVSLVYGFTQAEEKGWGATETLVFLGAAAVLLVSFVLFERRSDHPLLPMRIVMNRNRAGAYIAVLVQYMTMFAAFFFMTYFLQNVLGYSPIKSGLAFLPMPFMVTLNAQIASRLIQRVPTRLMIAPGLIVGAIGMLWLSQLEPSSSYWVHVAPALALMGIGLGYVIVPSIGTATAGAQPSDAGVASAMVNTSQQIGASIGTSLLGTIAASASSDYLKSHADAAVGSAASIVHGYDVASTWGAGLLIGGAVLAALLINVGRPARPAAATEGAPAPEAEPAVAHL
jgi:EmrB/QacA subfamily drug resistance transporter